MVQQVWCCLLERYSKVARPLLRTMSTHRQEGRERGERGKRERGEMEMEEAQRREGGERGGEKELKGGRGMSVPSFLQILVRGLRKVSLLSIARIKEIAVHVKIEDVK